MELNLCPGRYKDEEREDDDAGQEEAEEPKKNRKSKKGAKKKQSPKKKKKNKSKATKAGKASSSSKEKNADEDPKEKGCHELRTYKAGSFQEARLAFIREQVAEGLAWRDASKLWMGSSARAKLLEGMSQSELIRRRFVAPKRDGT